MINLYGIFNYLIINEYIVMILMNNQGRTNFLFQYIWTQGTTLEV